MPWRPRDGRTPVQDTSEPMNTMDKNKNEDLDDPGSTQLMHSGTRRHFGVVKKKTQNGTFVFPASVTPEGLPTITN